MCSSDLGLGRVVATVDHVEAQLRRVDRDVMCALAGHEGVQAQPRRLLDRGRPGTRENADPAHAVRTVGQDLDRAVQDARDTGGEFVAAGFDFAPRADLESLVGPEPPPELDPDCARQENTVPDLAMAIQGKVDAVQAQVRPHECGELAVAQAANFPGDRIELHGNNKSEGEIQAAISYGVRTIVLDSLQEIERVARIANGAKKRQRVMIRLTPGVEAHTHEAIKTAHEDVKFGFSIASGAAREAVLRVRSEASLELVGVHAHIGSQIFVADGFDTSAQRLIGFLAQYRNEFGSELPELKDRKSTRLNSSH